MSKWIHQGKLRRIEILTQTSVQTAIPTHAIEKDWWVTMVLQAIFQTRWGDRLVFKGGTSLTKSWKLIERFSEDIDLAIDKEFFEFSGAPTGSKIERLRRQASEFICTKFKTELREKLLSLGIPVDQFKIQALYSDESIRDPQVLALEYISLLEPDPNPYLKEKVLIEVGARSLREPSSSRPVTSIISETFAGTSFADPSFMVQTVDPKRTFLEKAFLLHEIFCNASGKPHDRMSRHLYDLERLMHTEHARDALADTELYKEIIAHRKIFNVIKNIDYASHQPATIQFIPPDAQAVYWENDYRVMQDNMIYGDSLSYTELIVNLKSLLERFRKI